MSSRLKKIAAKLYDFDDIVYEALGSKENDVDEKVRRDEIAQDFTNDDFGLAYKSDTDRLVICIARQTGAGGHEIGYRLAERLGIDFCDDDVIDGMMKDIDIDIPGMSEKDLTYVKQSKVIEKLARERDCVIVGRACGHVLMVNKIPRFSVFIGAPVNNRINRKMLLSGESKRNVEDAIRRNDKKRKSHYNYYTGREWGNPSDFDICINSACYGIEGTVDVLANMVSYSLEHAKNKR